MKKIILLSITLAVLIALTCVAYFVYDLNRPITALKEKKTFQIEKGEGVNQVALKLKDQGIMNNTFNWETYLWMKEQENALQAGTYELTPGLSSIGLANKFIKGNIMPREIKVTIPEGFTAKDIDGRLAEKGLVKQGEFIKRVENYKGNKEFCSLPEGVGNKESCSADSLEGYLFPDTYIFFEDATVDEIINKMLVTFDKRLTTDLRQEIARQGKSVKDVIILSSVVEKEVRGLEDMKKAASVFYNRLAAGMPLESDATVNYIIGKGRRQATLEDISIDSPYNSYRYKGLPPGPISNPGLNAIKAVIYPAETNYFYFLSPENNSTIFSKTLEEHNKAKQKYL